MIEGQISNIVDFGAFVDLDGIDGLIHISELSWSHVNHPSEILSIGDTVQVKVLDIDRDRQRISLGLKQTQEDPWQRVVDTYNVGDELEGKVTKVVAFGAFVEILEGVEGLVHISELAQHHVENPREIIQPGDDVKVKILEIDSERRRLSLSIKRVEGQVLPQRDTMAPHGDVGRRCRRPRERARAGAVRGRVLERARGRGSEVEAPAEAEVEPAAEAEERRPRPTRRSKKPPPKTTLKSSPKPPFVGLTGGIGAGKSEALAALERLGAATLSTDAVVHELYEDDEVRAAVMERFGTTDRSEIARAAFATDEGRKWLEELLWPRVGQRMWEWRQAEEARSPAPRALVVEVPLLFESEMDAAFDATVGSGGRRGHPARAGRGEGARGARRAHVASAHPGGKGRPGDVHGRKLRDDRRSRADARRGT